jgi:A/G-specific adenine glycosylase
VPAGTHAAVLDWYSATARPLAFRATTDPYEILVSELMAQQTQAARAAEAWRGFLQLFPTFGDLAAASPAAVVRAWRGLGYNRRALALRAIAVAVVTDHGGRLPEDLAALQRLPGIGPYTARALAALAFGQSVGPVDTNVGRVLQRVVFGLDTGVGRGRPSARELQTVADAAVPPGAAAVWTHALMDIGATLCRPKAPRCEACPIQPWCRAAEALAGASRARSRRKAESAASAASAAPMARPRAGFQATRRWLRGRIVERLCDAPDGEWVALGDRIGEHGPDAIEGALAGLRRDGLVERHPSLERFARLPRG